MVDIRTHNREAWNKQVEGGRNEWTLPVTPEEVAAAREGRWGVYLTPTKTVPSAWFGDIAGSRILGLACGGGQQGPLFAAAGARVTIFDNSPRQLGQDRMVAEREGLEIRTVEGDMRDLSVFPDSSFDLVFHPVSNNFVPEIRPVWREAYRVLRPGGALLAGFGNPAVYLFDWEVMFKEHRLEVRYALPYAMPDHMTKVELQRYAEEGEPLEFSHSLEDQIGGQIDAGFLIAGFYEDTVRDPESDPLAQYMPTFIATRAIKPSNG